MTIRRNRQSNGDGAPGGGAERPSTTRRPRTAASVTLRVKRSSGWPGQPSPSDIACRAFLLYLQRGGVPGHDLDDWLQAERELIAEGRRQC